MQYKIPIQIENEDTIVAGLSLRQLIIIMVWGGVAYSVFQKIALSGAGETVAAIVGIIIAVIGIIIALTKVAEMTFLPVILSIIRLSLNAKTRMWSVATDSYSDLEIGYVVLPTQTIQVESNISIETRMSEDDTVNQKIQKL